VFVNSKVDAEGKSWRSGAAVEIKVLRQWYLAIGKYADRLTDGLETEPIKSGWPQKVGWL